MREIRPWFGLTSVPAGRQIVVLGCPFEGTEAYRGGASRGPRAIREWTTTAEAVTEDGRPVEGVGVVDLGDVVSGSSSEESRWAAIRGAAGDAWRSYPAAFQLGLGGDHGVTPPLAAAALVAAGELGLLLLDAHPDTFDAYQGRPLSHACVVARLWDRCGYTPGSTCIVGVRSYGLEELGALSRAGLVATSAEWQAHGSEAIADRVLEATEGRALYVSLDIDVLDPAHAPGTGYPVAGGPSVRQLLELLAAVWRRQPVAAMDLVEVAPTLDPTGITASAAAHICLQVCGHVARSREPDQQSAP